MTELTVVDRSVGAFDTVSINPDGRLNYSDGRLKAVYEGDDVREYRVALYHTDGERSTVELPDGAVVLNVGEGVLTALIPVDQWGENE